MSIFLVNEICSFVKINRQFSKIDVLYILFLLQLIFLFLKDLFLFIYLYTKIHPATPWRQEKYHQFTVYAGTRLPGELGKRNLIIIRIPGFSNRTAQTVFRENFEGAQNLFSLMK